MEKSLLIQEQERYPKLTLLLYHVQSPINIGMILRTAELYEVNVILVSSEGVIDDAPKMRVISDFSCGAFKRRGLQHFNKIEDLCAHPHACRLIATSIERTYVALNRFDFQSGDIVLLGNEYDGLPENIINMCTHSINIPTADVRTPKPTSFAPIDPSRGEYVMREGSPSLNVAVAASIICYQSFINASSEHFLT